MSDGKSLFPLLGRWAAIGCIAVATICGVEPAACEETTPDESGEPGVGEKLFALQVQPIFREKCFGCHSDSADEIQGGFRLQSRESMLRGGDDYGDSVVAVGEAEYSPLMAMISREETGYEMPPKEADRLSDEDIWAVRDWIDAGAPWPDDVRVQEIYDRFAEGVTVMTSGGLSDDWTQRKYKPEDLWAYQSLQRSFEHDSIDGFIDAEMKELGIQPAPPADRRTLIRRATFDLLGLPPEPADVEAFVADPRDDREAFADLVERLLGSPHYGEQWARHWLDVARYSDSSGFANDWERPNAWRYRDYVVRAFNRDKPFDQFTVEQLAGDELAEELREKEKSGQGELSTDRETELLVAAGFLRMGPWEHTAMSVAKVTRQQYLDDITDSVGQVFLAQPLQCCRCHDHKFDPIPTRDFYSIQAAFATTQFADRKTNWHSDENLRGMEKDFRYHEKRRLENEKMMQRLDEQKRKREADWFAARGLPYESIREAKQAGMKEADLPKEPLRTPKEFGEDRIGRKWRVRFDWERDRYQPFAYSVYSGKTRSPGKSQSRAEMPADPMGKGRLARTHILTGGDPFADGPAVTPGVLSAVSGVVNENGDVEVTLPESVSGRRLALARWMISDENPLTPRVIANRIWTFHFGRGIAGNPNNFGATGKKPTHPELLDWLAIRLRENGWSIKDLHRRIMNSAAYRRGGLHPEPERLAEIDPRQESYATFLPRRMESEEIRDSMLQVSGELNPEIGGIPVRPDMNLEASLQPRMIMGTFAPSYVAHPQPEQRNRRSIYIHNLRGHRLPFMETFNQPGSETSCELRDQSNVTPQVFTLMNSEESNDRALALADRVLKAGGDEADVIERLFQLVYQRSPDEQTTESVRRHWHEMTARHERLSLHRDTRPTEVVREAIDENTGKPFTFTEKLFAYEDYVPDLLPSDVDARTRGLGDVCLMLINSNEFIYIY